MSTAESGARLAERYHRDVVAPCLLTRWPSLAYAAGRLGSGSDVLGYDDVTSQDHDWGLRLNVLVEPDLVEPVRAHLRDALPQSYAGRPVRFGTTWRPDPDIGVQVDSPSDFARSRLGLDPGTGPDLMGWLSLTGQAVLEVVAGPVFVDTAGDLTRMREALRWYPDDVWRYVVGADWRHLAEELPVAGRAGSREDDTGSRVVMGRLVGTAMHLAFLLERRWPPYAKWLGTAFATLSCAEVVGPALDRAVRATHWRDRQEALVDALDGLLAVQRSAGLPAPDRATQPFFDRPFTAVQADVVPALTDGASDRIRSLPAGLGSIEQWFSAVDILVSPPERRRVVEAALGGPTAPGVC